MSVSIRLKTLSGPVEAIPPDSLEELEMTLRGPALKPDDDGYDEARVVQNAFFDCRPGLIVRCAGTADVMDTVRFAREHRVLTAVRSGGHSVAGHCTADDALMIDLSAMRGVWVDAAARIVRVQGGATWGDVDRESQAFGLVVPGGIVSTTGVAGLTLGGGIGWLHRKYGLACDSLRSVELVSSSGELVRASESENEELFWGVRGGGGNFGIVTMFEFEAHPLGPIVMCAAPIYGIDDADDVFRAWRDWTATVPDEVTSRAIFWTLPGDENFPPAVRNQAVLILGAVFAGPAEEGETILQPIRELGTPLADLSGRMPYRMFQASFDHFFKKGEFSSYWKSIYLDELSDAAIHHVLERARNRPSPETLVHVPLMGGATSRGDAAGTAFGDRAAPYMLSVDGNWRKEENGTEVVEWVRSFVGDMQRLSETRGTYLNFSGEAPGASPEELEDQFGQNLERLKRLKEHYDPENLFRLNSNIVPAAQGKR